MLTDKAMSLTSEKSNTCEHSHFTDKGKRFIISNEYTQGERGGNREISGKGERKM